MARLSRTGIQSDEIRVVQKPINTMASSVSKASNKGEDSLDANSNHTANSHRTATTVSSADSFYDETKHRQEGKRRVRFNGTVRVRSHVSHRDMTPLVKSLYWNKRPTSEGKREIVLRILEETTADAPELVGCSYKLAHSLASSHRVDTDTLASIMRSPSSFAKVLYTDDYVRGLEQYISPTHSKRRKNHILKARSVILPSETTTTTTNDTTSEHDIVVVLPDDEEEQARRYAERCIPSRILARLRGAADEMAVQ